MRRNPLKIVLALVVGLFFAEGLLWGMHLAFGGADRSSAGGGDVLCIGDSHTFGWNVDALSAYPAQLQGLLAADGLDMSVTNRGAAGKNTTTLLEELDEYLALDSPRIVLILAGINNPWSRPPAEDDAPPAWYEHTRLAKFTRILWTRFSGETRAVGVGDGEGAGDVEETKLESGQTEVRVTNREGVVETFVIGGGNISHAEGELAYEWIKRDLGELATRIRAFGATPVVLTYTVENSDVVKSVNYSIRKGAEEHDIALIDVATLVAPELDTFGKERLIFPDAHPRVEGYRVVARIIHDGLVREGLIQAAPLGDPFAPLRDAAAPRPTVTVEPDGDGGFTLALAFDPVLDYSLVLSQALSEPGDKPWLGMPMAIAQDALFLAAAQSEYLRGTFDTKGRAILDVRALDLANLGAPQAGPVYAQLVARTKSWTLLATSEVVQLR